MKAAGAFSGLPRELRGRLGTILITVNNWLSRPTQKQFSLLNLYPPVCLLSTSFHLHWGLHACKIQSCTDDSARRVLCGNAKDRDRVDRPSNTARIVRSDRHWINAICGRQPHKSAEAKRLLIWPSGSVVARSLHGINHKQIATTNNMAADASASPRNAFNLRIDRPHDVSNRRTSRVRLIPS